MWVWIGRDQKEVRVKCLPCKARHNSACFCSQFSVVMFLHMSRGVAFVSSASTFRIIEIYSPRTLSTMCMLLWVCYFSGWVQNSYGIGETRAIQIEVRPKIEVWWADGESVE